MLFQNLFQTVFHFPKKRRLRFWPWKTSLRMMPQWLLLARQSDNELDHTSRGRLQLGLQESSLQTTPFWMARSALLGFGQVVLVASAASVLFPTLKCAKHTRETKHMARSMDLCHYQSCANSGKQQQMQKLLLLQLLLLLSLLVWISSEPWAAQNQSIMVATSVQQRFVTMFFTKIL